MNRVILIGHVGTTPELNYHNEQAVLNLRLATSESWIDKGTSERKERTTWHSVTIWGKRAEGLAKFVDKGTRLAVEGRIEVSKYEKAGEATARVSTAIIASNIEVLTNKGDGPAQQNYGKPPEKPTFETFDETDMPF